MKRSALVVTVASLLGAVPALASSGTAGTACTGTKNQRTIALHVHGVSCRDAYKSAAAGNKGFTCKTVGHSKKLPFTLKCVSKKRRSVYYSYKVSGG